MDVILFGPGDFKTHRTKDAIMVLCMLIASGGCWYAFLQKQSSQQQIKKMMKDLESLQKAEQSLMDLQGKLNKAKDEQEGLLSENQKLEEKLKSHLERTSLEGSTHSTVSSMPDIHEYGKVLELEEELRQAREQLAKANRAWTPPIQLQLWLQLTHEIELKHYNQKRILAEQQLMAAKEGVSVSLFFKSSLVAAQVVRRFSVILCLSLLLFSLSLSPSFCPILRISPLYSWFFSFSFFPFARSGLFFAQRLFLPVLLLLHLAFQCHCHSN